MKKFFALTFVIIPLTACTGLPKSNTQASDHSILEVVKNLDTLPDTSLGNQAVLIKEDYGFCQIEFTGFYQAGKIVENWAFSNNKLISASTTKFRYSTTIDQLEQDATIVSSSSVPFDITKLETQKNFENLRKNFSSDLLQNCNL